MCNLIRNTNLEVIKRYSHKCRYHKKGQYYTKEQFVPEGLCPEAFHSMYPYALGLLYNIKTKDDIQIQCPNGKVIFKVSRRPSRRIRNKFKKIIDYAYPVDPRSFDITIEVIKAKGKCLFNHKPNQIYEFNQNKKTELCPAAFDSVWPFLKGEMCCQDHKACIVFKTKGKNNCCKDFDINIKIINAPKHCGLTNKIYKLKDIMPSDICASLFHNCYPYIYTHRLGGSFRFNKKQEMVVQCPSHKGRVAVNVKANELELVQQIGFCPKHIPNKIILDDKICYSLFDAIFPYVVNFKKRIKIHCPDGCVVELNRNI